MKKKVKSKLVTKKAMKADKNHICFLGMCICKHPSFLLSLITLLIVLVGVFYFLIVG